MLFLNKILPVFVLPLGVVVIFLLLALVRKKRWPVGVALMILYLSSMPLVGNRLIRWLESHYPAVPVAQLDSADAVVVLGGIFGPPMAAGMLPNFGDPVDRFEAGVILMQANKAPWLIFTGGRIPWETRLRVEGEDSKIQAELRGVPATKILVTREVGNTADEARAVADLVREHHWRRVILVTTAWHMPRAARLFKQAGVDSIIFPVDFRCGEHGALTLLDFVPSADALHNTEMALRECYGYVFYAITQR